jgi:parallel beta-helix repeat protein
MPYCAYSLKIGSSGAGCRNNRDAALGNWAKERITAWRFSGNSRRPGLTARYGSRLEMLFRIARSSFRRRRLLPDGLFASRILLRAAGAACVAAGSLAAVAVPANAVAAQASITPGRASAYWRSIAVTNLRSFGAGSLRAAIRAGDAIPPGKSAIIRFSVSGTITLTSRLPAISRRITIDATSAPGHYHGGPPVVEINCNGRAGLRFAAGAGGSRLLGVAVDNARGSGVRLDAGRITLNDNYIGLDLAGGAFGNHGDGVYLSVTSSRNVIGLNSSGASGVIANVISGNRGNGIALSGSSRNTLVSNRIGTNAAGTSAIPNRGDGISITGRSDRNQIGGTDFVDTATGQANNPTGDKGTVPPVFVVPPLGNLISGNARDGVLISGGPRGNVLNGNFVGTTARGDAAIRNAGDGVWINRADGNSLTGCKFVNNPFVYYNVVSGNGRNGLRITNSDNTVVQGNFFGIGANNTTIVRNRLDGIRVDGSSANTQVGGVIPLGNVSAGNGRNGIEVTGTASKFTTFNTFGGLLAFKGAAPNGNDGLLITSTGGGNLARTNVFSGNRRNGIELAGNASRVTVDPNIAGLTTNGRSALPNGGDGVLIDGTAHDNMIGGHLRSVIPQNTFSGNRGYGLAIVGRAHGNHVVSTFVGTKIGGIERLGNQRGGILIGGSAYRNSIGYAGLIPANVISGNSGNGVTLWAGTRRNRVINNFIGLDRVGRYLRNTGRPIVNRGRGNIILGNRTRPRG